MQSSRMDYQDLFHYLKNAGKDPSSLVFEDELTGLHNRRFLLNYLQYKINWDTLAAHHVSLLMMDVDNFKKINDTYGHDAGDHALIHVARMLKDVCPDAGLPIRYGGDEFMILLAGRAKKTALEVSENLVKKIHENPLRLKDGVTEIFLTLSIGVAEAPGDAENGTILIQKADTALYHAKQSGRDRVSDAANTAAGDVFPKVAIQVLNNSKMAGREAQLTQVTDALKEFSRQKSRFLIVEGADGMGKSAFLQEVQRTLEPSAIARVKVFGSPQELFRPYYLISNLLVELLNMRKDKGKSVLDALSPADVNSLSFVLPSLAEAGNRASENPRNQRETIFQSLIRFINNLVDFRPLMVFADDLHFADEASLLLLRAMMLQNKVPLFLCGTTSDFLEPKIEINPLQRFWYAYGKELEIQNIILTPLSEKDIAEHLEKMFPAIARPAGFEKDLYLVTKGNPLFVSEILNKLIQDEKVVFTEQRWIIRDLDPAYLSASLDEIITQIIISFDEDTKRILNYTSIFGESVSLSMLTGSSGDMETRVLDFLDKAKAYGIVISDFRADDENIRFLSKRIQKIVYGSIEQDQKEDLHEKIALYQEKLFEKRLLPSAAILAWHFQRSANMDKARIYDQQNREYGTTIFNADEAVNYSIDGDTAVPDVPLDPAALKDLSHFFRSFIIAVNGIKLYPSGNKGRANAILQVRNILDRVLADRDRLRIIADKDSLIVNGETIDTADSKSLAESICNLFVGVDLGSLAIRKGYSERDLDNMLEAIGLADRRKIHPLFWQQACEERGLECIELKQVRYTRVEESEELQGDSSASPLPETGALQASHEQALGEDDLVFIPIVISSLLGALSKMRLYPPESSVMTDAVDQVMAALAGFLSKCPVLTMSAVETSLLVNGVKIDTLNYEAFAGNFLRLLQSASLNSITFIKSVSSEEVISFLAAVIQQPASEVSADFWRSLEKEENFKGILFNRSLYTVFDETSAGTAEQASAEGDKDDGPVVSGEDSAVSIEPAAAAQECFHNVEDLASALRDLFLCDEEEGFSRLLKKIFHSYSCLPGAGRESLLEICEKVAGAGGLVLSPRFLKPLAEQLRLAFKQENEEKILERLSRLLQQAAFSFLQSGGYSLAGWVFAALKERMREIEDSGGSLHQSIMQSVREPLPPHVIDGIREDLKSSDLTRQQQAIQFLSTMDDRIAPFLIDIIKQEHDLRVRQLTAGLMENMGMDAVELFKRDLVLEVTAEEQARMLDVADIVSRDIHVELSFAMSNENPRVRRAAFRLAERLNDEHTVGLLCDIVRTDEPGKAIPAIRALGRMKAAQGVPVLLDGLNRAKEHDVQTACCQALGQIADPAGMDPLIRILTSRGLLSLQKKYSDNLRAVAAFALAQISHSRVMEVMKSLSEDSNPLVRQTARAALTKRAGDGQPGRQ
ncbi:MAG: diguanylate cyclase [Syntrophaceae bacterium]